MEGAEKDGNDQGKAYWIHVHIPLKFNFGVDVMAVSPSFRQVENVTLCAKDCTGDAILGSLRDTDAADISRIALALNLRVISKTLARSST